MPVERVDFSLANMPGSRGGVVIVRMVCADASIEELPALFGPVRLVEGRWPGDAGEVVVSDEVCRVYGYCTGSVLPVNLTVAAEGNPLMLGTRHRVIPVHLRVVGVLPRELFGPLGETHIVFSRCSLLFPVLEGVLGRYLEPWGYGFSREHLWAWYAIIYLERPSVSLAEEVMDAVKDVLSRHNITLYRLYYNQDSAGGFGEESRLASG
ncbi:hypothetical protein [Hyperthermus butylicus]|uniref:hypothetical protein n=1 Tax=Hyperthermus butylicus TaxID=54248 RepID=UPI00129ACE8B|nr:hypothetical protein [Hyperthermus butylicus]